MSLKTVRISLLGLPIFLAGLMAFGLAQEPKTGKEPKDSVNPPKPFLGKVVRVTDGDTITVLLDGREHEVRLETIDAPERNQPFGQKAKEILSGKISGKNVKIVWKSKDKYKRIRGQVFLNDRNLCLEMVAEGYAWHYRRFSKDPQLNEAEKEAREAKRGLWADANPIPPWDFRKASKNYESPDPARELVYVTPKGKAYHIKDCNRLKGNPLEMTLEKAIQRNYQPCKVCKPPVAAKTNKD